MSDKKKYVDSGAGILLNGVPIEEAISDNGSLTAAPEPPEAELDPRFEAILAPEGVQSGDARMFAEGSLVWRDLPLPLSWQKASAIGHDNSVVVGKITEIWRDGNLVKGRGVYDLESEEGREANRLRHEQLVRGVSVDVDDVTDSDLELIWPEEEPDIEETDELLEAMIVPELMVWHHGRIMGATQVAHPAFQESVIGPDTGEMPEAQPEPVETPEEPVEEELVAAAEPPGGAMIALVPTEEDAAALAISVEGALAADDLHITLWYLGDADLIEPETRQALAEWLELTAAEFKPVELNAFAVSAFNPNEDPCVVLQMGGQPIVDAKDLFTPPADLFNVDDIMQNSPFCAHLTLAYTEDIPAVFEAAMTKIGPVGFNRVRIAFAGENTDFELGTSASAAVTASASADIDPSWFQNPNLSEPTPWTVLDNGRCFGHLAIDNTCHVGIAGTCVTPPKDDDGSYFATGEMSFANGERVAVGQVTFGTGHAPTTLGATPSKTHYDNTGYCGADVAYGRDRFGTWVAGAVRPWVLANSDKVRELRAASVSGDWRKIGNRLRLMAVLAVNVPGFPVPRPKSRIQNGSQTAMVAAGMVTKAHLDLEPAFEAIAASIGRDRRSLMDAMTKEIHG